MGVISSSCLRWLICQSMIAEHNSESDGRRARTSSCAGWIPFSSVKSLSMDDAEDDWRVVQRH
jgi:hypothetical protein